MAKCTRTIFTCSYEYVVHGVVAEMYYLLLKSCVWNSTAKFKYIKIVIYT